MGGGKNRHRKKNSKKGGGGVSIFFIEFVKFSNQLHIKENESQIILTKKMSFYVKS